PKSARKVSPTQNTAPPFSGIAAESSAVMSAVGKLQIQGRSKIPKRTTNGLEAPTASSNPNAPPATQKKVTATKPERVSSRDGRSGEDLSLGEVGVATGFAFVFVSRQRISSGLYGRQTDQIPLPQRAQACTLAARWSSQP